VLTLLAVSRSARSSCNRLLLASASTLLSRDANVGWSLCMLPLSPDCPAEDARGALLFLLAVISSPDDLSCSWFTCSIIGVCAISDAHVSLRSRQQHRAPHKHNKNKTTFAFTILIRPHLSSSVTPSLSLCCPPSFSRGRVNSASLLLRSAISLALSRTSASYLLVATSSFCARVALSCASRSEAAALRPCLARGSICHDARFPKPSQLRAGAESSMPPLQTPVNKQHSH
jgi:hypothetical protein